MSDHCKNHIRMVATCPDCHRAMNGEDEAHSQQRMVGRKRTYRNPIRFNCSNYHRMLMSQPANCYNCVIRDGYPQNLGGDKACRNFAPNEKVS